MYALPRKTCLGDAQARSGLCGAAKARLRSFSVARSAPRDQLDGVTLVVASLSFVPEIWKEYA